jgi:multicomponent Na+:H+ antiporter subunit B
MSREFRIALFAAGAAGLGALLASGIAGLPDFGSQLSRYGSTLNHVAVGERHATNLVAAVVFDYRGVDTLAEELILFASVMGVALLLREVRDVESERPRNEVESPGVRVVGLLLLPAVVLLGVNVVAHGYLTPGGGFQGGVVLAAALLLVFLAGDYRTYRSLSPARLVDLTEGSAVGGFLAVGLFALATGSTFLENVLPLGTSGSLLSAGTIAVLNGLVGVAVAAAFVLLFTEFLEEAVSR